MIEVKQPSVLYLDKEDYSVLHAILAKRFEREGEPIPPFRFASEHEMDSLVKTPQATYFGREVYQTLEEKAAIIFYTINKKQIFLNGNKRMSTLSLLVFLMLNDRALDVSPDELTDKALWLANTPALDFPAVRNELVRWIGTHLIDIPQPN